MRRRDLRDWLLLPQDLAHHLRLECSGIVLPHTSESTPSWPPLPLSKSRGPLYLTLVPAQQRAASTALRRVAGNFGLGLGATVAGFIVAACAGRLLHPWPEAWHSQASTARKSARME